MAELRQMYMSDLPKVLQIIDAHDEDDAEAAEADYHASGFDGQFVFEEDDEVIGITGYRMVPATNQTAWLSWTYLKKEKQGLGLGKQMTSSLIDLLREQNTRKLFVKVSDYEDPENGKIYERALHMYQSIGFELEITGNDFYDAGENQLILALDVQELTNNEEEPTQVQEEKPIIRFDGLYEIADTDGAYSFSWIVKEKKGFFDKRNFNTEDLLIGLRSVKEQGGRKVFLTFPSNLVLIHTPLQSAGFKFVGKLKDYYERGVDELHFTHDLSGLHT